MASEPHIEHFFATLADADFSIDKVIGDDGNIELLPELLWYMKRSRAEQVCDELNDLSDEQRELVIQSLASLYPLSRELLARVLLDVRGGDANFIKGFDRSQQFCRSLKETLAFIESESGGSTRLFDNYKHDVDQLEKKANDLRARGEQFKDLQSRKATLEAEVERLQSELSKEKLEHDIDALRDEERRLRAQIREHEESFGKQQKIVNDVKNELKRSEKTMSRDEQQLLADLFARFPADAEDEK